MTTRARGFAVAVGLMSIGFGIFDSIKAKPLAAKVGMDSDTAFRLAGAREIATGVAALVPALSAYAIGARLAGDIADIATLGVTVAKPASDRKGAALAGIAIVAAVTLVDLIAIREVRKDR